MFAFNARLGVLVALALFVIPVRASAINVSGAIITDTTWTAAGSPYVMTGDVVVNNGVTLTLEPGAVVQASVSSTDLVVSSGGILVADADGAAAITLSGPTASTSNGAWGGIVLDQGSAATLDNVVIQNARIGIDADDPTDTLLDIRNVEISMFSSYAVRATSGSGTWTLDGLDVTGPTTGSTAIYATSLSNLRVINSTLSNGAYGINMTNGSVDAERSVFTDFSNSAVRVSVTVTGTHTLSADHCTFLDNGNAVNVQRNTSSSTRVLYAYLDNSIFGGNTYILRDSAASSSYRSTFVRFANNVWWDGSFYVNANAPTSNTGNLNYNGLLADPDAGNYAPTTRSPARYFNPASPTAAAGALPYAGDPSPAGVHGFWYEDATFAPLSVTDVAGDMVIAPGATITFLPGATFNIATTDAMSGGLDPNRVEIRVEGTLEADGTNSRPVLFTSAAASPAPRDWYGIIIPSNAEAFNVAQVDIGYAYRGVSLYDNSHIVAGSDIHDCHESGIYVEDGDPSVEDVVLHDNGRGMSINDGAYVSAVDVDAYDNTYGAYVANSSLDWNRGRVFDNASYGIYDTVTANGTWLLTLRNLTIAHNGTGLWFQRNTSSSVRTLIVALYNSSITHNSAAGVRDGAASTSYRATLTCSGSNIWGNSPNYTNTSVTSCISVNPLYADAAGRDYAPTVHSPNRALGSGGTHIGALPYAGALGPQLMGYLWDDFTFTAANSPYTILGDITVPPGSTVSFEPGVVLHFADRTDGMQGGNASSSTEFNISGGDVIMDGSGAPITFTVDNAAATSGNWWGITATDAGNSVIENARVEHASVGLRILGPGSPEITNSVFYSNGTGVFVDDVNDGSNPFDLLACDVIGTGSGVGVDIQNSNAEVRSSYITHTTTAIDTDITSNGHWSVEFINNTLVHQTTGIQVRRNTSSGVRTLTVTANNNVVAGSTSRAFYDAAASTSYRSTVYLRNNNWYDGSTVYGSFSVNAGNRTSDPFVEDDDWETKPRWWDGKLWATSLAIDQGYNANLPPIDRLGNPRTIGSSVDIGAFEFDPTANQEPRADAVATSMMVPTNEPFTVDGSAAFDPDGTIASAYWTFSDDTVLAGTSVTHTLTSAGARWGYMTVVDNEGAEDHALVSLNVNNRPVADAGPQVFQDEGTAEEVYFDGTGSTDSDGTLVSYVWDFGDGSATVTGTNPRHSYLSAGNYVVTLTVTDNEGLSHSDTTLATVFGTVDTTGPLVQHTEIADGQPLGAPVTISATVTDPAGVQTVILYHRPIGATVAQFVIMTNTSGDTYEGVIAGGDVPAAGVEYWIQALDDEDHDSITPAGAPASNVWDFLVTGDPNPPVITHTEIADGQTNGEAVTISANITDETGVGSANLYFRTQGGASFGAVTMNNITGTTWSAQIPGFVVAPPGVEYYIDATDTSPIPNVGRAPAGTSLFAFAVSTSGDTAPPVIAHTPVADGQAAGVAVSIPASIVDADGEVVGATVLYRITGSGGVFTPAAMTNTSGSNWSASIPGAAVTEAGVDYYVSAADDSDNEGFAPASAPTAVYAFTVTPADTAGPSITHTPVADGQEVGTDVTVQATVTDSSGVDRVEIRYRPTGVPIFSTIDMTASGDLWTGQIPGFSVSPPGMEYYVRAYDNEGNQSTHPVSGQSAPHTFTVVDVDEDAPEITHTPVANGQTAGEDVSVTASITDASAVTATLYYRAEGATVWVELDMPNTGGTGYGVSIPGAAVTTAGVEYYLTAVDALDNETASPASAPTSVHAFTVEAADMEGPTVIVDTVDDAQAPGVAVIVSATVFDASGLDAVALYYRAVGATAWTAVAMTPGSGSAWTATIPGAAVTPAGVEYYVAATDDSATNNETVAPTTAPATPYVFTVVTPDTAGPSIVHTGGGSLPAGDAIVFEATVTDPSGVDSVTIVWTGTGGPQNLAMTASGDVWTATLPWTALPTDAASLDYYVSAVDTLDNTAVSPVAAPISTWTLTFVYPDTEGPEVALSYSAPFTEGIAATIGVTATDAGSGVISTVLEYRAAGATTWTSMAAVDPEDHTFTVPGAAVVSPAIEVRATSTDANGNPTTTATETIIVNLPPDTTAPVLELTEVPDGQTAGVAVTVTVVATDASGFEEVTLNYRAQGASSWANIPFTPTGADDQWQAEIPGIDIVVPGMEFWVEAVDTAANAASAPAAGASAPASFTVTLGDTAGPAITHTPPSLPIFAGETVLVSASVTDPAGVASVTVYLRNTAGDFVASPMAVVGGRYEVTLTVPDAATFEYYIAASDSLGNLSTDPATAPLTWRTRPVSVRDTIAPAITHAPVADNQTPGAPVAVVASITDAGGVASAQVYYRAIGGTAFASITLSGSGDTWSGILPGTALVEPGIEYYISASDHADPANMAAHPAGAPTTVHTFTVGGGTEDTSPPSIAHAALTASVDAGTEVAISALISDASGVDSAQLYFRVRGTTSWLSAALVPAGGGNYTGAIPSLVVVAPGVDYYLSAVDASAARNAATAPASAPTTVYSFDVTVPDTAAPTIVLEDPTGPFTDGVAITLGATITDASGVASAELSYLPEGAADWVVATMTATGDLFTATVPGVDVLEGELAWFVTAADTIGNSATAPAAGASGAEVIVVDGVSTGDDLEPPTLMHTEYGEAFADTALTIDAVATDASGIDHVAVYYRVVGEEAWASVTLTLGVDDVYSGEIPAEALTLDGLEYYLSAVDASDAGNEAFLPADAPLDWYDVLVLDGGGDVGDDVGPDAGDDVGTDAGDDAGDDVGTDVGDDAGDDVGTDAGDDAGDDVGGDAGADAGGDAGVDGGTDGGDVGFPDGFDFDADDTGAGLVDVGVSPEDESGCACSTQRSPASVFGAWMVLAGLLVMRRRRA